MKVILIVYYLLLTCSISAQTSSKQEKIIINRHYYQCQYCGHEYSICLYDIEDIKNPAIKKCMGAFLSYKNETARSEAINDQSQYNCKESKSGEHFWKETKHTKIGSLTVVIKPDGDCDIADLKSDY